MITLQDLKSGEKRRAEEEQHRVGTIGITGKEEIKTRRIIH